MARCSSTTWRRVRPVNSLIGGLNFCGEVGRAAIAKVRLVIDERVVRMNPARCKGSWSLARACDLSRGADDETVVAEVRRRMQQCLSLADQQVEDRRARLRHALSAEDSEMSAQRAKMEERARVEEFERRKRRAEEIKNRKEAEMKELVEKKRVQQYMERCEAVRPMIDQRNLVLSKQAQLAQIKEKQGIQQQRKKFEDSWTEAMKKDLEAKVAGDKMERDMEAARKRTQMAKAAEDFLKEQVVEKQGAQRQRMLQMKEEEEEAARIKEELQQEDAARAAEEVLKKQRVAEDLRLQVEERRKWLEDLVLQERLEGEALRRAAQGVDEQRKMAAAGDKESRQREIQMFQRNVEQMKAERRRREHQVDAVVQQEMDRLQRQRDAEREQLRRARQKLLRDTLEGLDQQVESRKLRALEEQRRRALEAELVELERQKHERDKEEHARLDAEFRRRWAQDLKEQQEYAQLLKRRHDDELERQSRAAMLEHECYGRLLEELIAKSTDDGPQHPFTAFFSAGCPPT